MNCVKYVIIFHDDDKHRKSPLKWYILSFGTFLSDMHWFGTILLNLTDDFPGNFPMLGRYLLL